MAVPYKSSKIQRLSARSVELLKTVASRKDLTVVIKFSNTTNENVISV